tara:strand:- start:17 stop:256 length:240 start_codon:yes stop_codon:yes gene_type:complete
MDNKKLADYLDKGYPMSLRQWRKFLMDAEQKEKYHPDIFSVKDLKNRLAQVGLPFEEVDSGSDGVICLCFATDDEDYNG